MMGWVWMKIVEGLAWLLVLASRGLARWVLLPFAFLAWVTVHCWAQQASLQQAFAWYDANFTLMLANGPLRFAFRASPRPRFVRLSRMREGQENEISWSDLLL